MIPTLGQRSSQVGSITQNCKIDWIRWIWDAVDDYFSFVMGWTLSWVVRGVNDDEFLISAR
jgi:hypothetical protein